MDEQLDKIDELMNYNKNIFDFEEDYLKGINKNYDNKEKLGYLINSKDMDELKENINYSRYKSYGGDKKALFVKNFDLSKLSKIKKINQIEFKTSQYLINMIFNDNKYIMINEKLWKIICSKEKENDTPIIYNLNSDNLSLQFDKEATIFFSNNKKNIIDKYAYNYSNKLNLHLNFQEINNICNDIKTYNDFEKKFSENLIKKKYYSSDYYSTGYLISKRWLDKWKKYRNYEKIKNKNLLENNINHKELLNEIIFDQEESKINQEKLEPPKILNLNSQKEINSYLKGDSLVIIDNNIKLLFKSFEQNYSIKYSAKENKIYILNDEKLAFDAYNNIIFSKENYNLTHLNIMVEINYFQGEMNQLIKEPYKIEENYMNNKIYLLNKNILETYKKILEFDLLTEIIKKDEINFKAIYYEDFSKFISLLDKNYIDKVINKNILDEFKLNCKSDDFKAKILEVKEGCINALKYLDNFNIINEKIYSFLTKNNIIKEDKCIESNYIKGDGKIVLIFKYKYEYFYEIGYFNSNNNFITEYLIKENHRYNKFDIIKILAKNGIDYFINKYCIDENKNEIKGNANQTICYYYKIKCNENNNCNINDSLNFNEDEQFIFDMLSFLTSLFLFEEEIKIKIQDLNNNSCITDCYIINRSLLLKIKDLFLFKEFEKFMDEYKLNNNGIDLNNLNDMKNKINKVILNAILTKKNAFLQIFSKYNKYTLEKNNLYENLEIIYYPINFDIINKNIFLKLKSFNNDVEFVNKEELSLAFNKQIIYMKPNKNAFFYYDIKSYSYNYIYLLNLDDDGDCKYIPYTLLRYDTIYNRNNHFNDILNNSNFNNLKFNCKSFLKF